MPTLPIDHRPLRAAPIITGMDYLSPEVRYRRPQGIEDYLLVLTLGGQVEVGPPGQRFVQKPGDLLLIEPHHALDQTTPRGIEWPRVWVIFSPRPHWYDWLDWPRATPGYRALHVPLQPPGQATVREGLEAVHRHATGTHRRCYDLALNALEAALLACDDHNPRTAPARLDPRVIAAMEFIRGHLPQRLTLDLIADAAGLSTPHLARLFRRQLDLSPMMFAERERLQRASELLTMTAEPVAAIAARVGFESPYYFSTRFKRYTGQTPLAYRRVGPTAAP